MKKRKMNKSNIPKHKRLNRNSRMIIGKQWISKFDGNNIVKSYSKYFNVDKLCAAIELEMLGHKVDPEYVKQLKANLEGECRARERRKRLEEERIEQDLYEDSDDAFYYIAGHTSGGMPYGITWEEYEREEVGTKKHKLEDSMDDDIPF